MLCDPQGPLDEIVIVMLVSRKRYSDSTVTLNPADHSFIQHESCVDYSSAMRISVKKLIGRIELRDDMSAELLIRVRHGLFESHFTVDALKKYCEPIFGGSS